MGRRKQKNKSKTRRRRSKDRASFLQGDSATATVSAGSDSLIPGDSETLRFSRRLRRARPRSAPDELPEDTAIWDVTVRERLPAELAEQASAIAEALACLSDRRDAQALHHIETIPRSSPYSDWRLFIRGLADWYAGQYESAHRCWQRLDPQRRPARIAAVLRKAESDEANGAGGSASDEAVERSARLVRQLHFERPWIAEAERETSRPEPDSKMLIGPAKVTWLLGFRGEYRPIEPDFVRALEVTALERAFHQPYFEVFERLAKVISGPAHDPYHRLLRSRYHEKFEDGQETAERLRSQYLKSDLAKAEGVREPLRKAIESRLLVEDARSLSGPDEVSGFPFAGFLRELADPKEVEKAYQGAIAAYPQNVEAHQEYIDWLRQQLDAPRVDKRTQSSLERRLESAMEAWSAAVPDEVEPRLWLVERYLDEDRIEEAEPHVSRLERTRLDSPRGRALPWRFTLIESMRHARRKTRLEDAEQSLERAETLWPAWLDRTWLPFLRAALALRAQDEAEYQRRRREAEEACAGPVTAEAMMFAAAQRMRVPAKELRPLREAINQSAKRARSIALSDLLGLGAFFWDLSRTNLMYGGYRNHGSKLGRELMDRLSVRNLDLAVEKFEAAALWAGEYRFWCDPYRLSIPHLILREEARNPKLAASILRGTLRLRWPEYALPASKKSIEVLRAAAQTEKDFFYRHLFRSVVEEAEEKLHAPRRGWSFGDSPWDFAALFGDDEDDDDEDGFEDDFEEDLDDPFDFDPQCDCPRCRANRARAASQGARPGSYWLDDDELDEEEDELPEDSPSDWPEWARPPGETSPRGGSPPDSSSYETLLPDSRDPDDEDQEPARRDADSRAEDLKKRRRRNPYDPQNKRRGKGRK